MESVRYILYIPIWEELLGRKDMQMTSFNGHGRKYEGLSVEVGEGGAGGI